MSLRRLKAWEAAGLVDATTAARIREWESSHTSPVAMRAVIGIAALAIGLGLLSVIAANWDAVPGVVRLGVHFALMVALALWLWRQASTGGIAAEAGLFVLGMLGLTFFGHIGQVYQTDSPLWQPLTLWLVLFAPLMLLRGTGWLTALLLMAVMIMAAWTFMSWTMGLQPRLGAVDETVRIVLAITAPVLLAALAAWAQRRSSRQGFWRRLAELAQTIAAERAEAIVDVHAGVDVRPAARVVVDVVAARVIHVQRCAAHIEQPIDLFRGEKRRSGESALKHGDHRDSARCCEVADDASGIRDTELHTSPRKNIGRRLPRCVQKPAAKSATAMHAPSTRLAGCWPRGLDASR